jgi:hypothetical protein
MLATSSSNLLSISPCTPIPTKSMVVVTKGGACGGKSYEWCIW